MDFRQVTTFLAIADELHFGRAAARLNLAQSSVSEQLQRLERHLGVRLVVRTSHEVRLTAAGEAFRAEARRLVEQADRAVSVARAAAAGRTGTVDIGFNFVAAQTVLPAVLLRLRADYPGIAANPRELFTGAQLDLLSRRALHVGLVFGGRDKAATGVLRRRHLFDLPVVAMVDEGHRFAGRTGVPFAEVAEEPCVLFRREHSPGLYDAVIGTAERTGIALRIVQQVDDPSATALFVRTQGLVAFASAGRATGSLPKGLTAVPITDPVPTLSMQAAWRADHEPNLVGAFLTSLDRAGPHRWP